MVSEPPFLGSTIAATHLRRSPLVSYPITDSDFQFGFRSPPRSIVFSNNRSFVPEAPPATMADTRSQEAMQKLEVQMEDHDRRIQRLATRIDAHEKSLADICEILNSMAAQQNLMLQRLGQPVPTNSPLPDYVRAIIARSSESSFEDARVEVTSLYQTEFDAKQARGECLWCPDEYAPGHKCSKKQVFTIDAAPVDADEDILAITEPLQEKELLITVEEAQTSIPALTRPHSRLHIAVDSGSTHNFSNAKLAAKLCWPMVDFAAMEVGIANGSKLLCAEMHGIWFPIDVLVIPLVVGCCLLVLVGSYHGPFNFALALERDYDGFNGPGTRNSMRTSTYRSPFANILQPQDVSTNIKDSSYCVLFLVQTSILEVKDSIWGGYCYVLLGVGAYCSCVEGWGQICNIRICV